MSDNQEPQEPEDSLSKGDFESMLGPTESVGLPPGQVSLWSNLVRAYAENRSGILVKGVIIAEVIDADGDRNLVWSTPDDMMAWEVLGMTDQIRADVKAENQMHVIAAFHSDDDEDDDEQ
jgi:hypothetical protein